MRLFEKLPGYVDAELRVFVARKAVTREQEPAGTLRFDYLKPKGARHLELGDEVELRMKYPDDRRPFSQEVKVRGVVQDLQLGRLYAESRVGNSVVGRDSQHVGYVLLSTDTAVEDLDPVTRFTLRKHGAAAPKQ